MYQSYISPLTWSEALAWKNRLGARARACAGGTDLLLALERAAPVPAERQPILLDLTRIPGLAAIEQRGGRIHLGALVTHNQCVESPALVESALPLARACWEVGAPPLRNRATVVGNVVTASPANDTIVPLRLLDCQVHMESEERGVRTLPLDSFITGFRTTALAADELVTGLSIQPLRAREHGIFLKLGLRSAQAISVVSAGIVLRTAEEDRTSPIEELRLALGAVAPVVVRAPQAERRAIGQRLSAEFNRTCAEGAADVATPIDDVRGTAEFRRAMATALIRRGLDALQDRRERDGWGDHPIMLWGSTAGVWPVQPVAEPAGPDAEVNGQTVRLPQGRSLLDGLRDAGFHEVKKGCAEGECGSCTVHLDGMAVLSCLIPAERAAGSQVVTASGEDPGGGLERMREALVRHGGVQCGYCIPGFVMCGAKLWEEQPAPTLSQAQEAYMGNLCRCTGYAKILDATVAHHAE